MAEAAPMADDSHCNEPLFVYGSLMHPRILNAIAPTHPHVARRFVSARLPGYVRHPYHNEPYPGMIASSDPDAFVDGVLIFGLTPVDHTKLDEFEGDEYTRASVPVAVKDQVPASKPSEQGSLLAGSTVTATTYLFSGPRHHLDLTKQWDYEAFARDHLDRWMQTGSDFSQLTPQDSD
ncbi:hypothetical protein DFQ27_005890 [Actinomortierella ambigua]|uniref:Putative gamma-glutamylcyclotransferase n=1 Tax=Actinomortierella ambigua TaxID=1343610 RepID=A0A9P6Q114_9FUNG|nr:hypothetical protein DFQ27_005890 [Actinomortierella ambigua]